MQNIQRLHQILYEDTQRQTLKVHPVSQIPRLDQGQTMSERKIKKKKEQ